MKTSKEPSIPKLSNLLQLRPSDLIAIEGTLSEIQSMKRDASGDREETRELETWELHTKRLIKGLKNPKKFLRDELERSVDYINKSNPELTSGYFDFLHTYLLCCYSAIKYRTKLGYGFPPNEKNYKKFVGSMRDSYGPKTIGKIEKPKPEAFFGNDFFEDAARRFKNIRLQEKESFVKLSWHFKLMALIFLFNTRDILPLLEPGGPQPPPLTIHFLNFLSARSQKSIETLIDEKIMEGWGFDLVCRALELIGYWEGKRALLEKSQKAMNDKKDKMKTEVVDLYFRISTITEDTTLNRAAIIIHEEMKQKGVKYIPHENTIKNYLKENEMTKKLFKRE